MRVVLDTNVLMSGIFFSGPPARIVQKFAAGELNLALSEEIIEEYYRVGEELADRYPGVDPVPLVDVVVTYGRIYQVAELPRQVCDDPDDDKFLACALACGGRLVISGDRALLRASGYREVIVVCPRDFLKELG